jgi:hypothetical protein
MDRTPPPLTNPCGIKVAESVISGGCNYGVQVPSINRHVNISRQTCGQWVELIDV